MIQLKRHKFHGISLLELMLALVIIAMIIFTVTRYYRVTEENLRVTQAVEMINNIVKASYQWEQGQSDFTNLTTQVLIDAGLIPDSYKLDPWKGVTAISGSQPPIYPYITMYNLPEASCQNLLQKLKSQAKGVSCSTPSQGTVNFQAAF